LHLKKRVAGTWGGLLVDSGQGDTGSAPGPGGQSGQPAQQWVGAGPYSPLYIALLLYVPI